MGAKRRKKQKGHNRTKQCDECDRKFKGKMGLAVHKRQVHHELIIDMKDEEAPRLPREFHTTEIVRVDVTKGAVVIHYGTRKMD